MLQFTSPKTAYCKLHWPFTPQNPMKSTMILSGKLVTNHLLHVSFWRGRGRGFYIPVITLQALVTTCGPQGLKMRLHYVRDYLSKVWQLRSWLWCRWDEMPHPATPHHAWLFGCLADWITQQINFLPTFSPLFHYFFTRMWWTTSV